MANRTVFLVLVALAAHLGLAGPTPDTDDLGARHDSGDPVAYPFHEDDGEHSDPDLHARQFAPAGGAFRSPYHPPYHPPLPGPYPRPPYGGYPPYRPPFPHYPPFPRPPYPYPGPWY